MLDPPITLVAQVWVVSPTLGSPIITILGSPIIAASSPL